MNREIGIIIRVKDAAKAKDEIKQIVDKQILERIKQLNLGLKETGEQTEKAGRKAKEAAGGLDKFFRSAVKGAGVMYTLHRSMSFAMSAFEQGAGLERAGAQFETSVGRVNRVLPELRAATRGTVEDLKLLQTANRAVIEGMDPRKLAGMYRIATVASRKLGLDTEQSIQTVSNAIIRQDESALTTLGTILKTNIGLKVQSALIAKNGGVMSGVMAMQIRQAVIMDELNRKFGGFNALQEDSVEILERFRASMSNLRMSIGQALGTALAPLLKVVTSLAQGMSDFLMAVKDTAGFKMFIQYAAVLAGIFTAKGLLGGLARATKYIAGFAIGLKGAALLAAGMIGFKALGGDLNSISQFAEKAQTVFSTLFQLLSNYDSSTGMTEVLTKDKEALGGLFTVVFQGAKVFLSLYSVVKGVFKGISSVFQSVAPMLGVFGEGITEAIQALSTGQPLLQSTLNKLERMGEIAGKALMGIAALYGASSVLSMLSYFTLLKSNIIATTALYGAQAIAWAAANPIAAAALGVAAVGAAAYMGIGADENTQGKNSHMSSVDPSKWNKTQEAPAPRAQNVEAAGMNYEAMMSVWMGMAKDSRRTADATEQTKAIEEQKQIDQRANPWGNAIQQMTK